jgi:diguanylate cyclase (GGDEF)-like protein
VLALTALYTFLGPGGGNDEGTPRAVVIAVVSLLVLSVVAIGVALMGQRAAAKAHQDLQRTTLFDVLTGLPDRARLQETLNALLDAGRDEANRDATGRLGALLLIELTQFEVVNDTYGHEIGDGLLIAVIDQLQRALLDHEQLFRLGGPQFVIVNRSLTETTPAEARADELQAVLALPFRIGGDLLRVATCSGVAMVERRHGRADEVLRDLVIALQQAHRVGPSASVVFDQSMRPDLTAANTERRLRQALERNEFWLLYLPVVALDDHELVGVEALLRWADPERGLVSPDQFLSQLESTGLIGPVGDWVVQQACQQSRDWQLAFPDRELITTINVSPGQLALPDFMPNVMAAIDASGADPSRICLEITEGPAMHNIDSAWAILRDAKDAGIKLALDDFGTGYSSLAYLRRFSLDVLKIDRTFVVGIADSREDAAIAQQLVAMAHALGIAPVAEGVSTAEQAQTLHGMGCDFAQGFYFSAPQPVTAIDAMLAKGVVRPADQAPGIDWGGRQPEPI